jgi:hypothetical protein
MVRTAPRQKVRAAGNLMDGLRRAKPREDAARMEDELRRQNEALEALRLVQKEQREENENLVSQIADWIDALKDLSEEKEHIEAQLSLRMGLPRALADLSVSISPPARRSLTTLPAAQEDELIALRRNMDEVRDRVSVRALARELCVRCGTVR